MAFCNLIGLGKCYECVKPADCLGISTNQYCEMGSHTCKQCLSETHCTSPSASVCLNNACTACTINDNCTHLHNLPYCISGTCKQCLTSYDCNDPLTSKCENNVCVSCVYYFPKATKLKDSLGNRFLTLIANNLAAQKCA
jgi:hypothetical protein